MKHIYKDLKMATDNNEFRTPPISTSADYIIPSTFENSIVTTVVDTTVDTTGWIVTGTSTTDYNYSYDYNTNIGLTYDAAYLEYEQKLQKLKDEEELRNRYDVIREAYEEYQFLLKLHEDQECDKNFKKRYGIDDEAK